MARSSQPLSEPTVSTPLLRAQKSQHTYLVLGAVHKIAGQGPHLDSALLHKLIQRRLKRLERVLTSHGGWLVKPLDEGLIARFHSAEAALIGACEMQRRCAVIPQLSDTQLALKIGIHATSDAARPEHPADPALATVNQMANLATASGIVLSAAVIDRLPCELREKSAPIAGQEAGTAAYTIDWNNIPMQRSIALPPVAQGEGPQLILRLGDREYRFDSRQSVVTIGRAAGNDIVVGNAKASRRHCRIVYRLGNYVLVDVSTNGTYLAQGKGSETHVHRNMATLSSGGRLSCGQPWRADNPASLTFEVVHTD